MFGYFPATDRLKLSAVALSLFALAACTSPDERAQQHLAAGQQLLAKGDLVKANLELRNALKNKKDLVAAWRGLAEIEEQRKNWAALAPMLKTIVEYDPNDADARLKLSRLMLSAGHPQDALPLVSELIDRGSPKAGELSLRAAILLALRDTDGAVNDAKRALAMEPRHLDALLALATERLFQKDADGALRILAEVNVATPDHELAVGYLRIRAFELNRDMASLESELRKLAAHDKTGKGFRRQLIAYYVSQRRDLDAEAELRKVASDDPQNIEATLELVRFLNSRKGSDAAQQELEDRINAGGDVFRYQLARAEFQYQRRNVPEAVKSLEQLAAATSAKDRKIQAQILLASIHTNERQFDAADPVIASVLSVDSRNIDALRLRAVARLGRGQLDDAVTDLRQALNDQPQSVPLLQLLGTALERTGAIELAEKQLADATRVSNFSPRVALDYVAFLQRRGGGAQAEEILSETASRNPNNVQVLTALAEAKLRRQDWVGAQEVADAIKLAGDQGGLADQIRGQVLSRQDKLSESIQALQTAFQSAPNALSPMAALVSAYMRAQKPGEAEVFLKGLISANPGNANAHVLLASVQVAQNRKAEALASIKKAIEQQPKSAVGYTALAEFQIRNGDYGSALAAIGGGLKEQPDNLGLRLLRGQIYLGKRDFDTAIQEYEAILAVQPNSLIAANNLASLLVDNRGDKASLERAQQVGAVLRRSTIPQFKDTVGWLSYHRGEYRTAIAVLEEAASELPTLADVRYHLGMAYLKAGQTDKAQEQLKKAAELATGDHPLKQKIQAALKES